MAIEKKVLFEINGFSVLEDSIYIVRDKKDGDAPSGFIAAGVSKLPSKGVDEGFQVPFHITSETGDGVWDTGFYVYSPCYSIMSEAEQKIVVKNLMENVVKPYRNAVSNPNIFSEGGMEDLTGLNFKVWSGKIYSTNNPQDVMELYFAIRSGTLAPKGLEGDSKYYGSYYIVVDATKQTKVKNESTLNFFKAASLFTTMFKSDKDGLFNLLIWIGMRRFTNTIDEGTLSSLFSEYSKDNPYMIQAFLDGCVQMNNELFKGKIKVYKKLKEYKGPRMQKLSNGLYYFDDLEIGADLKTAAENIIKDRELVSIKDEFLENTSFGVRKVTKEVADKKENSKKNEKEIKEK